MKIKVLKITFVLYSILIAFFTVLAGCSVFIRPDILPLAGFAGIIYPHLLILSCINLFIILLLRKKVLALIVALPFLTITANPSVLVFLKPVPKPSHEADITVLSYNVQQMGYYNWYFNTIIRDTIISYIVRSKCHVACLQEFFHSKTRKFPVESLLNQYFRYKYSYYNFTLFETEKFGFAFFSHFPLSDSAFYSFENTTNGFISADVETPAGKVRIFNCHLESFRFYQNHFLFTRDPKKYYPSHIYRYLKNLYSRFTVGYRWRLIQVDSLIAVATRSPYPYIICGDFNEVPYSYIYHKITTHFGDAYVALKGNSSTYRGLTGGYRLDYFFYSKGIVPVKYFSDPFPFSDHYPVTCSFKLIKNE